MWTERANSRTIGRDGEIVLAKDRRPQDEQTTVRRGEVAPITIPSGDVNLLPDGAAGRRPGLEHRQPGDLFWSPGELLAGRYRLGGLLGQGGMGEVFEVFDVRRNDERVAVKRMFTADPMALLRLKREYRRMAGIGHPNLVTLLGLAEHRGRPFILMEYVEGQEFYAALGSRGGLGQLPRLRKLLRSLATGILALHESGRVHCDLKGSNVLVTPQDRVVILDFGLVNELERRTAITSTLGRIEGTALYMSPEQAAGQLAQAPSDWYALGVMLFRAITGVYPISGNPCQLIVTKQTAEAPKTSHLEPDVPPDLDELIARLLCRAQDRRATALDVLAWCERSSDRPVRPGIRTPRPIMTRGLIGRERQQRTLSEALSRFSARVPLRVDIVGASGTGKTALMQQFVTALQQDTGFVVFESRCHEYDAVPYNVFDGLIDTLGRYLARLPRAELEPLLGDGFRALAQLFPTLRQVRDMSGAEAMFERLGLVERVVDPQVLRRRAFQGLRGLLHRLAASWRLVLVVDDLQWGDLDSARLLSELLAPPSAPPLMFLCAYRNEDVECSPMLHELATLQARTSHQHEVVMVETPPLSLEHGAELARRLLGGAEQVARAQAIAVESQGSPMLITAIVRYLGDGEELEAPTRVTLARQRLSVEQLAAHRLTTLGPDATVLLAAVAVAGQPTSLATIVRIAQVQGDPRAVLSHLRAASLIRTTDDMVEVYHPEIGRAIRKQLAPERLAELHRRLAEALGVEGEPERLAHHWLGAGDRRRACEAAKDAAEVAMRICAFEHACSLYRLALECVPDDPEVWFKLATALRSAGRVGEAIPLLLGLAERASRPAKARRYRREAAEHLLICGRRTQGLAVLKPLMVELSLEYPESERTAIMRLRDAIAALTARGLQWVERSRLELSSHDVERYEVIWTLCKGLVLTDIVRGGLFAVECALLALDLGEPRALVRSLALAGAIALERGVQEGRVWLKMAGEVAERVGDDEAVGFTAICWGLVLRGRGSWSPSLCELEFGLCRMTIGAAWEHSLAVASKLACLEALGEVASLKLCSLQVDKLGKDIGSARVLGLGQVYSAWTALAAGDVRLCRSLLAGVRAMDRGEEAEVVQMYCFKVEVECELFTGDPAAAWQRVEDQWPSLDGSRLLDASLRRFVALSVRARAGLALAASGAECPQHVMDVVTRDIAHLSRESGEHATPTVNLLRAGFAEQRGEPRVEELLRVAAAGFDATGMALHATSIRWILAYRARMVAADEDLVRAEALMRLQGIAEPGRWARMMVPGVRAS
jgi:hypothetical protein